MTKLNRYSFPLVAAACAGLLLTGCGDGMKSDTKSKSVVQEASKSSRLTAKAAADKLATATWVTTLGNPTDNTSGCASKDSDNGCKQLITTDTVSVYEFATPAVSAHWGKTMKANGDWRQVGRFALAFTARDQNLTSRERRVELEDALKKLVAAES